MPDSATDLFTASMVWCSEDHVNDRIPSLLISAVLCSVITGKARITLHPLERTRLHSDMKPSSGLKCCADSRAIILSTETVANGSAVAVEFTSATEPCRSPGDSLISLDAN